MTRGVFIDSGAFIAFLDASDRSHADVDACFAGPPKRWCTSLLVVSETYSWFLHRLGEDDARAFRALLVRLPGLQLLDVDRSHHAAVQNKLEEHRGRKLTYVDASSLVFVRHRKVGAVWGTDSDLAIEGAKVVPGPPP